MENVAFAGGVVFAVSGCVEAGLRFSLADAVGNVDPTVIQTLNVLQNDVTRVGSAVGIAVFLIANGIAVIRTATLPNWLGWAAVVLAIVNFALGPPAIGLWILMASIMILVRARHATPLVHK